MDSVGILALQEAAFLDELEKIAICRSRMTVAQSRKGRRPMHVDTLLKKEKEGTLYKKAGVGTALRGAGKALFGGAKRAISSARGGAGRVMGRLKKAPVTKPRPSLGFNTQTGKPLKLPSAASTQAGGRLPVKPLPGRLQKAPAPGTRIGGTGRGRSFAEVSGRAPAQQSQKLKIREDISPTGSPHLRAPSRNADARLREIVRKPELRADVKKSTRGNAIERHERRVGKEMDAGWKDTPFEPDIEQAISTNPLIGSGPGQLSRGRALDLQVGGWDPRHGPMGKHIKQQSGFRPGGTPLPTAYERPTLEAVTRWRPPPGGVPTGAGAPRALRQQRQMAQAPTSLAAQ